MPVTNERLARLLDERAEALGLEGANPYRIRAYRKAARAIEDFGEPVADLVRAGKDLRQIPGVGEGLAATVKALVEGAPPPPSRSKPAAPQPKGANELAQVQGLGPKRARALAQAGITTLQGLAQAALEGKLRGMPGFGPTLEAAILEAVQRNPEPERRRIRPLVDPLAHRLRKAIAAAPGVERVEAAGSFRRRRDTVADLDFVAVGDAAAAMDALAGLPEVGNVIARGPTKLSVRLTKGMQVDLRVVPAESFGAAMVYFTGSKEHNVALRGLAVKAGQKLNEYGLFDGERQVAGATEGEVYAALGMPVVPPELREDRGEVQAALAGKLPKLVELADIKGDLHTHTNWTDGANTLETMAKAAQKRGLSYMVVTDHTPRTAIAGGMPWERHKLQHKEVDRLNKQLEKDGAGFRVLKGAEVDILKDGRLDLPGPALDSLDVVVASLHFREKQSAGELTERVLTAMGSGHADILGHPSGRLIGKRPPMEHDWSRLVDAAKDQGWALEVDGSPWRQDVWDTVVHQCVKAKVRISTDSDAHSTHELEFLDHAVDQARRGWATAKDVLNTRSVDQLLKLLA